MSKHMPDRDPAPSAELVPLDRAHAALRRAAQLQADAIERLEQSARLQVAREDATQPPADGLARADIEAAAAGAGISPEFVRQALLEQQVLPDRGAEVTPFVGRVADRVLKTPQRTLEVRRTIPAPAEAVLGSMQAILPALPYQLTLLDCIGAAPLEGGVMVFGTPSLGFGGQYSGFSYVTYCMALEQIHASIRATGDGERATCELTLRADLHGSLRKNVWWAGSLAGLGAATGAALVVTAGIASAGLVPLIAAGAVAAAGAGGASGLGYGALYRYYLRKMERELESLLRVVDMQARTGFRAPQPATGSAASTMALLGMT
ncbi:MAG TPA: hypothetical protein VFH27_12835 [Longimicrobiaceae bacterium]|nr:hypothetical protein [Longimicrobiaceae bacterium]